MKTTTKVVFNTIVLYARILISMAISLITVPLVLHALGQSDYGLYSLVGGIVAMLGFLNNSMSVSTQRFMSVAMGEGNIDKINRVFNVNIRMHFLLGIFVVIGLELLGLFAFDKLNIEPDSVERAKIIFQFLIVTTFSHIICVPLNGVINAREDMLVFSIIGVIDSLLHLGIAALLSYISGDRLLFYGFGTMFVPIITLLLTFLFVKKAYPEYKFDLKRQHDKSLFKEVLTFSGWNIFGAVAVMARNQGTAVIINLFLGTIANAAYGIANQINAACSHFTTTFQKAINPQLMKSEGMGNRKRLSRISFVSSKFGVLAICLIAVPLIIEMPYVLQIWLRREIPPFTIRLSQFILLFSIVNQYSSGLMAAIQATGRIRNYTITMSFIILLNVPVSYIILKLGYPIYYCTAAFVVLEIISLIVRIFMSHKLIGMDINDYLKNVVYPTFLIVGIPIGLSSIPHYCIETDIMRFVITIIVFEMSYFVLTWFLAFDKTYRNTIITNIKERIHLSNRK